jgi:hypothetical protein
MDDRRAPRLVMTALRCYPARWRRRHGDEATELAGLLIQGGTPAGSIACSYLAGAAREWLAPRPGWRLSAVACALLVAASSLGVSAGLLAPAAAARAASTSRAHKPTSCPPGPGPSVLPKLGPSVLPGPGPSLLPAAGRPQLMSARAGRGRAC